jgi:L-malate glycosyltransferase
LKICYLADAQSVHTQRWAMALAARGHAVTVCSMRNAKIEGVTVRLLSTLTPFGKLGYIGVVPQLRRLIDRLKPSVLHAHYASSYGLMGALAGYHPYLLSVWGTDVFQFPLTSRAHAALLKFNLRSADRILSTSRVMAAETAKYVTVPIVVTPFGVDPSVFAPRPRSGDPRPTIGIVKPLQHRYGFRTLFRALCIVRHGHPEVRLIVVGDGQDKDSIVADARNIGLADCVTFVSALPHRELPDVLRQFDVMALPSYEESFGVVALEASASGLPVVASRIGGLPEVISDGRTGVLVPPGDHVALSTSLDRLLRDVALRKQLGREGRRWVLAHYHWADCVDRMEDIYRQTAAA